MYRHVTIINKITGLHAKVNVTVSPLLAYKRNDRGSSLKGQFLERTQPLERTEIMAASTVNAIDSLPRQRTAPL